MVTATATVVATRQVIHTCARRSETIAGRSTAEGIVAPAIEVGGGTGGVSAADRVGAAEGVSAANRVGAAEGVSAAAVAALEVGTARVDAPAVVAPEVGTEGIDAAAAVLEV